MRAVYFILSLLLISCSKDDASETPGKFELQSISIGEKQDQSSFENVAPSASIVLTFTDAVDEATIQSNIILKLNDQAVAYDSKLQGKEKLSLTPTGGFKSFSSYKLVINPGVKSTSGVSLTNGKVYEIRTGMDDSDKFDRIPDEDLLTLVQKQTFKYFWNFGHAHSGMACERTTSGDVVTTGGTGFGVMAMLVAAERGFVTRQEALERVQKIVTFLDKECTSYHGAYAHWINGATGETKPFGDKDDGADLVETSLLFQGLYTLLCLKDGFRFKMEWFLISYMETVVSCFRKFEGSLFTVEFIDLKNYSLKRIFKSGWAIGTVTLLQKATVLYHLSINVSARWQE
ncbi:MAG: Ig-like domain-containing protein [Bacteroides cellulosilyticus]